MDMFIQFIQFHTAHVFYGVIFGVCIFQNESNDATVEAGEQSLEDLMKQMKSLWSHQSLFIVINMQGAITDIHAIPVRYGFFMQFLWNYEMHIVCFQ